MQPSKVAIQLFLYTVFFIHLTATFFTRLSKLRGKNQKAQRALLTYGEGLWQVEVGGKNYLPLTIAQAESLQQAQLKSSAFAQQYKRGL